MRIRASTVCFACMATVVAGCGSEGENKTMTLAGDPKNVVGHLTWTITETSSGATLGQGERDVLLGEIEALSVDSEVGKLIQYKIPLSDGFNVAIASSDKDETGFGITAEKTQIPSFSWEWFQVSGQRATKLQETGELKVDFVKGQIARVEFLTDVSLRVVPMDETSDPLNPKWRILITKGSHFSIPR